MTANESEYECPLCRKKAKLLVNWRRPYSIIKCRECGLLFSDPIPTSEELNEFYQGFLYRKPDALQLEKQICNKQLELASYFNWSVSSPQEKLFLDHGGGTGIAYAAARRGGCNAFFFEIDQQAVEFVRQTFGLESDHLFRSSQDMEVADRKYNYIFSDNVIEHVQDPAIYLRSVYELLAPGGRLIVKTPHASNTETWFYPKIVIFSYGKLARRFNGWIDAVRMTLLRGWHCEPPRHIYSFTEKSILRASVNGDVPEEEASISWYRLPLWEYSLTSYFRRRPATLKGVIKRAFAAPLLLLEWPLKLLQVIATSLGLVSAGGLVLIIDKPQEDSA